MQPLRQGSRGQEVRLLQELLNRLFAGETPLALDGVFGPLTGARVRLFQQRAGQSLVVDGVVGPRTMDALVQGGRMRVKLSVTRMPNAAPKASGPPAPRSLAMRAPPPAPRRISLADRPYGPGFTRFSYDPMDAEWIAQMRAYLAWLALPAGQAGMPPPMPSLLPPSGSFTLRTEILEQFPWLQPPVLPSGSPPFQLPNFPNIFPMTQTPLILNGPRITVPLPAHGWTTEFRTESSVYFNPLDPKKPYKLDVELSADLYRLRWWGEKGAFNIGARFSPLSEDMLQGYGSVEVTPLKIMDDNTGLSLSLMLAAAAVFPPAGVEGKGGAKLEWDWGKHIPFLQRNRVSGTLSMMLGGKFGAQFDGMGGASFQGMPLLPALSLSIGASEPGHWEPGYRR